MAELLDTDLVTDYLLHGGSSSVLARGQCPGSEHPGWTIGLPHPLRPGERLAEIDLVDKALGTSGSATQSFEHNGQRYGHLLDPRTGRPVTGIFTATAIASSAAEADALSTAFYVMGPGACRPILRRATRRRRDPGLLPTNCRANRGSTRLASKIGPCALLPIPSKIAENLGLSPTSRRVSPFCRRPECPRADTMSTTRRKTICRFIVPPTD